MSTKGLSINIGINYIDKKVYGTDGALNGCVNDANSYNNLAISMGFQCLPPILNEDATYGRVRSEIINASRSLSQGDIFLLTLACHGSQIPSLEGDDDEVDGLDETWVLYDKQVIDDELNEWLAGFKAGVRIVIISDSCHSGTLLRTVEQLKSSKEARHIENLFEQGAKPGKVLIARDLATDTVNDGTSSPQGASEPGKPTAQLVKTGASAPKLRCLDRQHSDLNYQQCKPFYQQSQRELKQLRPKDRVQASVLLLSGCQDNQLSSDGDKNGLFTETLLRAWDNGNFRGDYIKLYKEVRGNMPPYQTPNYYYIGANWPEFENQRPFSIAPPQPPKELATMNTTESSKTVDSRFLETLAAAAIAAAVKVVIEEATRGMPPDSARSVIVSPDNQRFLETLLAAAVPVVVNAIVDELTRGGFSIRESDSRFLPGFSLPSGNVGFSASTPLFQAGGAISFRNVIQQRMGVPQNQATMTSDRSFWTKLGDAVADKVVKEIVGAIL